MKNEVPVQRHSCLTKVTRHGQQRCLWPLSIHACFVAFKLVPCRLTSCLFSLWCWPLPSLLEELMLEAGPESHSRHAQLPFVHWCPGKVMQVQFASNTIFCFNQKRHHMNSKKQQNNLFHSHPGHWFYFKEGIKLSPSGNSFWSHYFTFNSLVKYILHAWVFLHNTFIRLNLDNCHQLCPTDISPVHKQLCMLLLSEYSINIYFLRFHHFVR